MLFRSDDHRLPRPRLRQQFPVKVGRDAVLRGVDVRVSREVLPGEGGLEVGAFLQGADARGALGADLDRPDRAEALEVVRGLKTSNRALEVALALAKKLGKEAAVCKRDTVGFITTRAIAALRLECVRMYEEGIASMEDIDKAMRLGFNHPMGQFELTDFNGLDVALFNTMSLKEAYGERFTPPQSMVARVKAGQLGRKTGAGWYDYSDPKSPKPTK